MPSGALAAHGTYLQMGDGATPEVFTTIAEVLDIKGGGHQKLATEDVTSHSSASHFKEVVATLLSLDPVTFGVNLIPTTATHNPTTGLIAAQYNRTLKHWKLIEPDAGSSTLAFSAYVTDFNPANPVAGKLSADVELTPSGVPTWW